MLVQVVDVAVVVGDVTVAVVGLVTVVVVVGGALEVEVVEEPAGEVDVGVVEVTGRLVVTPWVGVVVEVTGRLVVTAWVGVPALGPAGALPLPAPEWVLRPGAVPVEDGGVAARPAGAIWTPLTFPEPVALVPAPPAV